MSSGADSLEAARSYCATEYDKLRQVVLCTPTNMEIREAINVTQEKYEAEGIDINKAVQQHDYFVQVLKEHGVDVVLLTPLRTYPEQVFTRDIGFTLGYTVFVSDMAHGIRQGEENMFRTWLEGDLLSYFNIAGDQIEGGDVLIDKQTVYIGISSRTSESAINLLKRLLPQYEIVAVPFDEKYLHLDCVFNILSPDDALIYPGVIEPETEKWLRSRYNCIEVTEDEQFSLGPNVFSIGEGKVFSLPGNQQVNTELRNRGFEVIEVDISEIIKSGGSFRCCTLPILRENSPADDTLVH
ncbi:dimethylarginine dimethylaminohydrolase family protein [Texcoconibacillus texcoconensis]|uniref:N-dimethylarginine dimethylaminohydrolase n=1 Tax=Texcoconibacillus texcoconensis TaxID=1095777 RepID=A0A840QLW6_9BACI|nr:dimethylarginine dimethylaminohydrolase family protein [Texcoconibacillus texcoconensis]MBB5172346.1 N-dimethylarginine dimethylaminohydrolase [Texcoconibacillus texcoconensis]